MRKVLAGILCLAIVTPALAGEVAGVTLPDTATVEGKTLKLNGMGLRTKVVFKVYVAGLYLEAKSKDGAAVIAADAPRVMRMQFVRDVGKEKLVEGFKEGFEANAKVITTSDELLQDLVNLKR